MTENMGPSTCFTILAYPECRRSCGFLLWTFCQYGHRSSRHRSSRNAILENLAVSHILTLLNWWQVLSLLTIGHFGFFPLQKVVKGNRSYEEFKSWRSVASPQHSHFLWRFNIFFCSFFIHMFTLHVEKYLYKHYTKTIPEQSISNNVRV